MDYLLAKATAAVLDPVLAPLHANERIFWGYLLTSLAFALAAWRLARREGGWRGFLAWVFPRSVWLAPGTRTDVLYFLVNRALYGILVLPWCVETSEIRRVTGDWLAAALPWLKVAAPAGLAKDLAFTAVTAIGFDFGLFLGHWLLHRVPFLWEFHKVHHSADVMTPITVYRQHPVDDVLSISLAALVGGILQGAFIALLGGGPRLVGVGGINVLLFAFYVAGYNLRHSHVWVSFGPGVERWLVSPAQHQVHHSADPAHFDRNLGFTFAVWDRLFGTLVTTTAEPQAIAFGTGSPEDAELRSVAALYLRPFREVARRGHALLEMPSSVRAGLLGTIAVGFVFQVATQLPGPAHDRTLRLEDLTWTEVRALVDHGKTTAIVPVGGTEQGGPHLALGKHNFVVGWTSEAIARELEDALVAPVLPVSPAGEVEPRTSHMRMAGTLTVSEATFEALLEETARSLAAHGFRAICFVGDHGWSQPGQAAVAARLTGEWRARGLRVLHVSDYYDDANGQLAALVKEGESPGAIGSHAGIRDTSELLVVNPRAVRLSEARPWGGSDFATSGVDGDPTRASAERGRLLLELKVEAAVRQIRRALATPAGLSPLGSEPAPSGSSTTGAVGSAR